MISVVVPTFEEEASIPLLLAGLKKVLRKGFEVVLVDDSPDNRTVLAARESCRSLRIPHTIKHRKKKGKGGAVMEGVRLSKGNIIVMIDADMEYDPANIPFMIKKLNNFDFVTSVRVRRDPFHRRILAFFFRLLVFSLYGIRFDTQSGLKVFKKDKIRDIRIVTSGWAWDVEFIYRALRNGLRIGTYEIKYTTRRFGNSKIGLFTPLKMFFDILLLRFRL